MNYRFTYELTIELKIINYVTHYLFILNYLLSRDWTLNHKLQIIFNKSLIKSWSTNKIKNDFQTINYLSNHTLFMNYQLN